MLLRVPMQRAAAYRVPVGHAALEAAAWPAGPAPWFDQRPSVPDYGDVRALSLFLLKQK